MVGYETNYSKKIAHYNLRFRDDMRFSKSWNSENTILRTTNITLTEEERVVGYGICKMIMKLRILICDPL